ncbi:hypothetical protein SK128_002015 [Halocaridina rubra]|uniref:Uncharacterized protein n=1 Tax=Halocaridina rubra TaxID=373956 RepID=A0AAN8XGB1_HALRR
MITQTVKLDIPDDKDSKENLPIVSDRVLQNLRLKAVKVVSKILTLGIPFDPPGSNEKHLLSLAITTSNRTLLPILLAAGLPLTTSHSGLRLLQLAWLNPVYSTWIGMVVTRAVMHRLLAEQIAVKEYGGMITATSEQCKILFKCISELVASLHKEAPHEARFQCDENALTEMFVLACRVGVTTTAWYIWKEGASLYERQSYETPLEAALNTKHMYTAKRLVLDMKSNPFLKGSRNNVLMDEFSSQERLELLEMMFSEEFRRLDRIMEKSKDKEDKRDMQLIILLYMILFLQYRYENNVQKWRSYFEVIRTHFCQMTQTSKRRRSDNPQSAEDMECSQMQKEPSNSAIPDSSENSKTLRFEKNSQTPEDMECSHLQKDPSNSAKSDNSENSKVLRYEKNSQTPEDMEFSYLQKDPSNSAMSGDGGNLETVRDKKKSETTEDTFNWMSRLSEFLKTNCVCEKLFIQNSDVQEEIFQMYSDIGITEAGSKIEAYNTIDEFYDLFATLENLFINHDVGIDELPELMYLLKKSLRISCEDHMPLFLHLLKTVAEVDLDMILNDLCQTRPLHHAAKYNNLSAIVYLLTRCASPTFGDCNGYLPVYYAFMYGHEITGFFLLGELEKIDPDGRINLQSVKEMALYFHQAHREYLILYDLNPTFDANSRFPRVQHCDELLSNCLNNVIKKWEQRGIRDYVHSITVDYNEKETKQVKEEVATFLTSLKNGIATKNSVFEGDLQFVGSSVDNVRLFCPDEYDCNLCLKNISAFPGGGLKCILSKLAKKSAILRDHEKSLTVLSERENVDLFEKTNFLNNFFSTVEEALFEMDLSKYKLKLVLPGIKRTQVGVAFSLMSLGSKYRMLFVDVDLVPTIKAPWPDNLNKPDCGIAKESLEEVHINSLGEGEWRFSFGQAETALMQTLTDEKREVYLACKMLLASFKTENWVPSAIRQRFKYWDGQMFSLSTKGGFALKNSFFQELEIFTEPNEWTTSNLLRRMCSVFGRMCEEIIDPEKLKMQSENANSSVYKAQEDNEDTPRYGGKRIKAFFGGDAEKSSIYLIAPDILVFLKSLNESIIVN